MKRAVGFVILGYALIGFSCKQLYTPPEILKTSNYLVIDGIINSGNTDSTVIKLSRTTPLNSATLIKVEPKARVTVESNGNSTTYILKEAAAGTYISTGHLNLDKTAKYRLRIITADNKTYLSDFVPVKEAPPIDSLNYTIPANGVQVYLNTHDPTNNTRYYRYDYVETYIIHAANSSAFIVKNRMIVPRTPAEEIFSCWTTAYSTDIALASSSKLSQDVIYQTPVAFIPGPSEKLRIRYSISVNQYALTEDAFNFWQLVKTNTESLGSIFDAQPSQIKGNIHNINDSTEPVFGYISAGTVTNKRIFIDRSQLPYTFGTNDPYIGCANSTILVTPDKYADLFYNFSLIPVVDVYSQSTGLLLGYTGGTHECTDCTLRGTNIKPAFWQ
jgi:hypothetical protein